MPEISASAALLAADQIFGSITALVTPFKGDSFDETAFADLVEGQIVAGTNGLVPCGTTGESPTLSHAEHHRVVEVCVEVAKGRIPVIAGAGSNSTREAIELTQHAAKCGADAALVVTPYYNKPTQDGLFKHYSAIHDATDIPIIIYNIPGRCVIDMTVETMARLASLPRIIGVNDATNDLSRPLKTRVAITKPFAQLSGEDATAGAFLAQGGHGCISVTANVAPGPCADMQKAWRIGDLTKFAALRDRLMPVHDAMFCETSPGPVKYALSLMGKIEPEVRGPLCAISDASKARVEAALRTADLLD